MEKFITLYTLILLVTFSACNDNCDPDIESATFTNNKIIHFEIDTSINMMNSYRIEEGENLVFTYNHSYPQCDDISDDELGEVMIFEIPNNLTEFNLSGDELLQANCLYQVSGAWVNSAVIPIEQGSISGQKNSDDVWDIEVSLFAPSPIDSLRRLEFDLTFRERG